MADTDAEDHQVIWLQPWCRICEQASDEGRLWCQNDAWGVCEQGCGRISVKYVKAKEQ